ncbi:hypothetical protein SLS56_010584 [Neofusicoccum ribis]|uniref:Protein kinase domain-containing protein n=1 Tax=Neofusicoccum ribis TaxID=45134 RepID=A0ABR3SE21_9PEZI
MDYGFSAAAFSFRTDNSSKPAPSRQRGWWTSSHADASESTGEENYSSCLKSRPSRRPSRSYGYTLSEAPTEDMVPGHTVLEVLVNTLQRAELPGPAILMHDPDPLGDGGQFKVCKQRMVSFDREGCWIQVVAVKTPKFPYNYDIKLDLASHDVRKHLNHVYNEIKALTTESLKHHPNIVRLFSWSRESYEWHSPLVLILELAVSNLAEFLDLGTEVPVDLKISTSLDIASGLEAIHRCRIIHGDLKPINVLIFEGMKRPVAKLADFGVSTEDGVQILGGTPEWQAPELRFAGLSTSTDLYSADRFSYGLVLWSIFYHYGRLPENFQVKDLLNSAKADLENDHNLVSALEQDLGLLLQEFPHARPESLVNLSLYTVEESFKSDTEGAEE